MYNKYFCQLLDYPTLPDFYFREVANAEVQISRRPIQYRSESTFNNSTFFKSIEQHFNKKCVAWYYITKPNTYYTWHVDLGRQFAINWMIQAPAGAKAFYREPIQEFPIPDTGPMIYNLIEAPYTVGKPTVLNTGYEHCVFNATNESRIILSMSILDLDYDTGLEYLKSLHLESY